MSVVTNLLLSFDVLEDEPQRMAEVNAFPWLHGAGLKDMRDSVAYGGTKHFELPLWGGAFNHLDLAAFIAHLRTVAWEKPANVRVIVAEQEDDHYRIETPADQ